MSKPSKHDTLWYPIFFMSILAFVMTSLLALLNYVTKDTIALQEEILLNQKLLYSMNIPYQDVDELEEIFSEHIEAKPIDFMDTNSLSVEPNYYIYKKDGEVQAYAFPVAGNALWGSVTAIVAMDKNLETVIGIDIISQSETPGLGGRIEEDWYKEQFRDISLSSKDGNFFIYSPQAGANIDAITGATLTSSSVKDLLNENVLKIKENFKGGQ